MQMKYTYAEWQDILITFNDIHTDTSGMEHVRLYFEKPIVGGFCFLETSLPDLNVVATDGFSAAETEELLDFARDNAPLIWDMARKGGHPFADAV